MQQNNERITRITAALREARMNALVCTLPETLLLLSGYWPVVGTSVAVATADGRVTWYLYQRMNGILRRVGGQTTYGHMRRVRWSA